MALKPAAAESSPLLPLCVPEPSLPAWLPAHLVAFLASLAFMLIELDAGRLVAWHVGSSLYSWTTVIGVMFAGMSLGNYLGGRLADRPCPRRLLGRLIAATALWCLLLMWIVHVLYLVDPGWRRVVIEQGYSIPGWVLSTVAAVYAHLDRPGRLVMLSAAIFTPPAVMLGMASPVIATIATAQTSHAGRAMGGIYAWGAIGSIVGTLAAGFWLIETLGSRGLLAATAVGLTALGLAVGRQPRTHALVMVFALLGLAATSAPWRWADRLGHHLFLREVGQPLFAAESDYQYLRAYVAAHEVQLAPTPDAPTPQLAVVSDAQYRQFRADGRIHRKLRELRALTLDRLVHGYVWFKRPDPAADFDPRTAVFDSDDLHYHYEQLYATYTRRIAVGANRLRPTDPDDALRSLTLGAGPYTFPRYLADRYPYSRHDVVEIDPAVTQASIRAFKLDLSVTTPAGRPVITAYHADARAFVEAAALRIAAGHPAADQVRYDVIFGDAFNHYSIPHHLTTREFHDHLAGLLRPGGAYIANVIDSYHSAAFLGWYLRTLAETFPHLQVAAVRPRKRIRTDHAEIDVPAVTFHGVSVELADAHGLTVLSTPAENLYEFQLHPAWLVITRDGRSHPAAEVQHQTNGLRLLDLFGSVVAQLPAEDVIEVRPTRRPPWTLVTSDGREVRGQTLRFSGGHVNLHGDSDPNTPGRLGPVTARIEASHVRAVTELRRVGRETFVIAASLTPLDMSEFGRRRDDPRFLHGDGRRNADEYTLLAPDEIAALLRRTRAGVFCDDYAPADVLVLPLFRTDD